MEYVESRAIRASDRQRIANFRMSTAREAQRVLTWVDIVASNDERVHANLVQPGMLAVAIHTLGMLAFADECPVTSEKIAESVQTNAVSIRRLFQALGKAGLVVGQMGPNGGARLARSPKQITLAEV
jgi:hypothetical protein